MKLTTTIRYALARMLLKAAALPVAPTWLKTSFLMPSFRSLVSEGYQKNAVVFACISALAFDFPEPPLLVYADESDDAEAIAKHPLRLLIKQPNPIMGEAELMVYTIAYMALGGNAYWHKVRDGGRRVVQLWPYHAGQIIPVPGGDTWIQRYDFDDGTGRLTPIPADDIVHFKWPSPDPKQPWMAQPPLLAAAREVDADNEVTRYLFALLKNDAVPRGVLKMPLESALTETEWRRMKAQWHERYGGDQAGDIAILEGGADYERIGLNLEELAFDALHRVPEKRIAAVFRVPLVVAGVGDDPTYANSEQAFLRYTRSTLAPLWRLAESEVQADLGPEFGNGVVCRYDLGRVQALQENENAKWARTDKAFTSGYLSFQETRTALGYGDPKPNDLFVATMNGLERARVLLNPQPPPTIQILPPRQLPAPADEPNPQPEPPKALPQRQTKQSAAAQRTARKLQRARTSVARRMEGAVDAFFTDLAERVAGRVGKAWRVGIEVKGLPGVDDLITADDWLDLEKVVKRYYVEIIEASWDTWNTALGTEVAFELSDPAVVAALKTAGTQVRGIADSTQDELRSLLAYGAEQGWTIDQLRRGDATQPGIRDLIEETYKNRARAIARTEMATAQAVATTERYHAVGVTSVDIFDNGQDDPDEECAAVNGTVQTLAWYQKNLLGHPNCTRVAAPHFD